MQMSCPQDLSKNNSWPLLSFNPMPSSWVACFYCYPLKRTDWKWLLEHCVETFKAMFSSCPWAVWASML